MLPNSESLTRKCDSPTEVGKRFQLIVSADNVEHGPATVCGFERPSCGR